jgi:hypothetical protein
MSFGREAVSLPKGEVDRLVGSLRDLGSPQGDSMAEEISALTLAGVTIDLRPTNAELGALVSAVVRIERASRLPRPAFVGLLRLAREQQRR